MRMPGPPSCYNQPMPKKPVAYVALLRGIGPMNPNMRNEKLRGVFEHLGFSKVQTVISSGNVLFETHATDHKALERMIERALPEQLGFTSTAVVLAREELTNMAAHNPFTGHEHSSKTYLTVTFGKERFRAPFETPYVAKEGASVLRIYDRSVFSLVNLTGKTPDLMTWLERTFSKQITTRTWKTVGRILERFEKT